MILINAPVNMMKGVPGRSVYAIFLKLKIDTFAPLSKHMYSGSILVKEIGLSAKFRYALPTTKIRGII